MVVSSFQFYLCAADAAATPPGKPIYASLALFGNRAHHR
jgi:hypothetical protein